MTRALLALLLSLAGPLQAAPSAEAWLARVAPALSELDYQGTLVYVVPGRMETFKVYHRRDGERERERLVAVSGAVREVVRDDGRVIFQGSDAAPIAFDLGPTGRWSPALALSDAAGLRGYRATLAGSARVAGHAAQAVELQPQDAWRYGYRLWLERESGFPLRVDLLGEAGVTLEQVAFTDLQLGQRPSEADLQPTAGATQPSKPPMASRQDAAPGWYVPAPPEGFTLRATRRWPGGEHLLYSDGLASVSIYLEAADAGWNGASSIQRGAVNGRAYWVDGWRVLAIGKVPAVTADHFARSVRPSRDDG